MSVQQVNTSAVQKLGVMNCPQTLAVLAKLCSQKFSGCSFARARIFLQVLACSVFGGGSILKSARYTDLKANFCQCSCSHARKDPSIPLVFTD